MPLLCLTLKKEPPGKLMTLRVPKPIPLEQATKQSIATCIDSRMIDIESAFQAAIQAQDLTGVLSKWSTAFEEALMDASATP